MATAGDQIEPATPMRAEVVDVQPGRIMSLTTVGDDGLALTGQPTCNDEQSLHHLGVEENEDQLCITARYGWRPDAVQVRVPSAVAADKRIWPHEIRLTTPLSNCSVIDGGTGETRNPCRTTPLPG